MILFGTPVWSMILDNAHELNQQLKQEGLAYQHKQNYFDMPTPGVADLKRQIDSYIADNIPGDFVVTGRQNVIPPGQNDSPHHHPGIVLVGVYYVQADDNSGDILLHDPRGAIPTFWTDPQTRRDGPEKDGRTFHRITPVEGMLLLFPNYVIHSVEANLSNRVRLSIILDIDTK